MQQFERPAAMPNLNNEGFAFAPLAECVSGRRAAFWSGLGERWILDSAGDVELSPF